MMVDRVGTLALTIICAETRDLDIINRSFKVGVDQMPKVQTMKLDGYGDPPIQIGDENTLGDENGDGSEDEGEGDDMQSFLWLNNLQEHTRLESELDIFAFNALCHFVMNPEWHWSERWNEDWVEEVRRG